jgi:formylglycine-generating enzyme
MDIPYNNPYSPEKQLTWFVAKYECLINFDRFPLRDYTSMTDRAAKCFRSSSFSFNLDGIRTISNKSASYLGQHREKLTLNGITDLTLTAAEHLGKHTGDLELFGLHHPSDEIIHALSNTDKDSLHLSLRDYPAAKEHRHGQPNIDPNQTPLSDAAAKSLARISGYLALRVNSISDSAAKILDEGNAKGIRLPDCLFVPPIVVVNQRRKWNLEDACKPSYFNETTAKRCFRRDGQFLVEKIKRLSGEAAKCLARHNSDHLNFQSLTELSELAARKLSSYRGEISFGNLTVLSDIAAIHLTKLKGGCQFQGCSLSSTAHKILSERGRCSNESLVDIPAIPTPESTAQIRTKPRQSDHDSGEPKRATEPANDEPAAETPQLKFITNTIGMTFNKIPSGTFIMGSPWRFMDCVGLVEYFDIASGLSGPIAGYEEEGEPKYYVGMDHEKQHEVTITNDFFMQSTVVTQAQWKTIMKTEPWIGQALVVEGADYPATRVRTERGAINTFLTRLSEIEGKTYRLPTEAEWEYACRAGTNTAWSFGDNEKDLADHAWYADNAYDINEKYAHQVGLKNPNPFGLYDMHGNVRELCDDHYDPNYYQFSPKRDPQGPDYPSLPSRVTRGGSLLCPGTLTRSACRLGFTGFTVAKVDEIFDDLAIGFRVVRELD